MTVPQCVGRLEDQDKWQSPQEPAQLLPRAAALAALVRRIVIQRRAPTPREIAEADWYSRRALELAPNDANVWSIRAAALGSFHRLAEALAAADRALELNPANDQMWLQKGWLFKEQGEYERSYGAYSKAQEMAR